jgi:hypothetical protein
MTGGAGVSPVQAPALRGSKKNNKNKMLNNLFVHLNPNLV